jgi:hypothetical protein
LVRATAYVRVVDLDIGASKSDIRAINVVTISERAGRNSSPQPRVGVETAAAVGTRKPLACEVSRMSAYGTAAVGAKRPFQTSAAPVQDVLRDRNDLKVLTGCADFIPSGHAAPLRRVPQAELRLRDRHNEPCF